ncbi:hypothetical protein MRX96_016593 [Rhipicephalus microplus]
MRRRYSIQQVLDCAPSREWTNYSKQERAPLSSALPLEFRKHAEDHRFRVTSAGRRRTVRGAVDAKAVCKGGWPIVHSWVEAQFSPGSQPWSRTTSRRAGPTRAPHTSSVTWASQEAARLAGCLPSSKPGIYGRNSRGAPGLRSLRTKHRILFDETVPVLLVHVRPYRTSSRGRSVTVMLLVDPSVT